MKSQDLIDCLRERYENRDWVYDTIRWAVSFAQIELKAKDVTSLYNVFRNIGTCEVRRVTTAEDIEQLSSYYLVWYKPNASGMTSPFADGSVNYRFDEYNAAILNGSISMPPPVINRVESFKNEGLIKNVDIVVGFDISIDKGLIVDGTKSSLALSHLRSNNVNVLKDLLASTNSINIVYLKSPVCRVLFPIDFCRLC